MYKKREGEGQRRRQKERASLFVLIIAAWLRTSEVDSVQRRLTKNPGQHVVFQQWKPEAVFGVRK